MRGPVLLQSGEHREGGPAARIPAFRILKFRAGSGIDAMHRLEEWQKWVRKEKQKMEGIADIRMRAADDVLKAAMRLNHAEMNIKAAQRAAMGLD